jgi:hypothetical protein
MLRSDGPAIKLRGPWLASAQQAERAQSDAAALSIALAERDARLGALVDKLGAAEAAAAGARSETLELGTRLAYAEAAASSSALAAARAVVDVQAVAADLPLFENVQSILQAHFKSLQAKWQAAEHGRSAPASAAARRPIAHATLAYARGGGPTDFASRACCPLRTLPPVPPARAPSRQLAEVTAASSATELERVSKLHISANLQAGTLKQKCARGPGSKPPPALLRTRPLLRPTCVAPALNPFALSAHFARVSFRAGFGRSRTSSSRRAVARLSRPATRRCCSASASASTA